MFRGALLAMGVLSVVLAGSALRADETPAKPKLVAIVNGTELTEIEFLRRCDRHIGGVVDTSVGYATLQEWIQQTIAEEEAKRKRLLPTPQDIQRRLTAVGKQFEFRGQPFPDWLASHGRTLESMRDDIRQQLIAENLLTDGIKVNTAEVQLYYEGNKQVLGVGEQIKASRITVSDKDVAREVDAALKKGTAFAEVATRYSEDPFKARGGRIPDPVLTDPKAGGALEKDVLEKVQRLEVGKVAGPIKLDDYWVFVRLEERIAAHAPELTDVEELIMANLKVQKAGPERLKSAQARLDQLQSEARVEIFRPEYRRLLRYFKAAG